jgi:hypothetical protein
MVVTPLASACVDLLRADEMDVRVDAARGDDAALPAITSVAAPMTMVMPFWISGLPAWPMPTMRPCP